MINVCYLILRPEIILITVIKFPAQSYVCVQSTSEIDEDIVITDIQNCRYYIAKLRQFCVVIWTHTSSRRARLKDSITTLQVFELSRQKHEVR